MGTFIVQSVSWEPPVADEEVVIRTSGPFSLVSVGIGGASRAGCESLVCGFLSWFCAQEPFPQDVFHQNLVDVLVGFLYVLGVFLEPVHDVLVQPLG